LRRLFGTDVVLKFKMDDMGTLVLKSFAISIVKMYFQTLITS